LPDGEIEIINISPEEFREKTSPFAVYNTILGQILSYEQRFHCSLKHVKMKMRNGFKFIVETIFFTYLFV